MSIYWYLPVSFGNEAQGAPQVFWYSVHGLYSAAWPEGLSKTAA